MAKGGQKLVIDVAVSAAWKRALRTATAVCKRAAVAAFEAAPARRKPKARTVELAIVLTSDAMVKKLNAAYRGKNKPTDVLSFPAWTGDPGDTREAILGDVVIAKDVTARDAKSENKTLGEHLTHLVVHGVLHLLGYDHEEDDDARAMERLEVKVLEALKLPNPYLARPGVARVTRRR
ncbi:MAG: rRNA maturation RNase YbeY [Rhodospirillaceae bacterium]|nr:rRNA maturation RNase YbeY [Rhodospirillaceae bacterium]